MKPLSSPEHQETLPALYVSPLSITLGRYALYFVLVACTALIPMLDLDRPNELHQNQLFTEASFVELSQLALLALSIIAAGSMWANANARALSTLLTGMLTAALVRELDYFLERWAFEGAWQVVMSVLLVAVTWVLWPRRSEVTHQLRQLIGHASFGVMFVGASIVLGFSRLFGRGSFWQEVLGDGFDRSVKNMAEETVELLGFSILAVGIAECVLAFRRAADHRP